MSDRDAFFPSMISHAACIPSEGCRVQDGIRRRAWLTATILQGILAGGARVDGHTVEEEIKLNLEMAIQYTDAIDDHFGD